MERSNDRLLSDLREGGILIPSRVSSIETLTTQDLFSTCAQCVKRFLGSESFDLLWSESVAEKVGACGELAAAVRKLGFIGEMNFERLLYPSEEDKRELLRFLAGRLAFESSVTREAADVHNVGSKKTEAEEKLENLCLSSEMTESFDTVMSVRGQEGEKEEDLTEEVMIEGMALVRLQCELDVQKAATVMTSVGESSSDSILEKLREQIDDKRTLSESELQWKAAKAALEAKKRSLEETVYTTSPDLAEKFQKLKQVELELDTITNEVRRKDREYHNLSIELKNRQKRESRRSYIQHIEEITRNSRKQEADVERILREIRELQLESNVIQERLHRTYAVLDETVFREAKKDQVGRQAYRLLTSIHESFEQVRAKTLSTDRVRREITEHDKKLKAMASRIINVGELQADIDSIIMENERLTQSLENSK